MSQAGPGADGAQQLLIFIREQDRRQGQPLYLAILELVRAQGGAGATVLQGLAGFSAGGRLIQAGGRSEGEGGPPVTIVVIDTPARIAALVPAVEGLLAEHGGALAVADLVLFRSHHPWAGGGVPLKVGQIMETQVVSVTPATSVADLVPLLLNKPYKALPVIDAEHHVLGMVTDGDLLRATGLGLPLNVLEAIQARGPAGFGELMATVRASGKTARDVMGVRPAAVIGPDAPIDAAAQLMVQQGVKRLPVVDRERRLIGIVGRLDVLRAASTAGPGPAPATLYPLPANARTVGDVMLPDVLTVQSDTPLARVADAIVSSHGARRAVVVDNPQDRHVLGIITAADLVRRSTSPAQSTVLQMLLGGFQFAGAGLGAPPVQTAGPSETAGQVMTAPALTVSADRPIAETIGLMVERGVKVLPVVDAGGHLLGIVNRRRLLQALTGTAADTPAEL